MVDLGYESHNELINLGSLFLLLVAWASQVGLYFLIKHVSLKKNKVFKFLNDWNKKLFYSELLRILIEGYLEFLIAGYLAVKNPLFTTAGEVLSFIVGIVVTPLTGIFIPCIIINILRQPLKTIQSVAFRQKWGQLYGGVKTRSKFTLLYYLLFVLRRNLFVYWLVVNVEV